MVHFQKGKKKEFGVFPVQSLNKNKKNPRHSVEGKEKGHLGSFCITKNDEGKIHNNRGLKKAEYFAPKPP